MSLNKIRAEQAGFILGLVLVFFAIFTIIGVAFIQLSGDERIETRKHYQRIKAFYLAEGGIQRTLWVMNRVSPAKASYSNDSVSVVYDAAKKIITATGQAGSAKRVVRVMLEIDHPFRHIVSYRKSLKMDKSQSSLSYVRGAEPKRFSRFPLPDLSYYKSIADTVIDLGGSKRVELSGKKLKGIVFINGKVKLRNHVTLNGTLVATNDIEFDGASEIHAQQNFLSLSGKGFYPAIVCAASVISKKKSQTIVNGAVYASKKIKLNNGNFSGPLVADRIQIKKKTVVSDSGSTQYYEQPPGFLSPTSKKDDWRIKPGSWETI